EIEQARDRILRKAQEIERQLIDDPIQIASLSYTTRHGFRSRPITIESEPFTLAVNLTIDPQAASLAYEPPEFSSKSARIRPLGILASELATLVPITFETFEISNNLSLDWVKERSRKDSRVYLIDRESGDYYYPIDTDLRGEVVAGFPRTGLIAFEPFRQST